MNKNTETSPLKEKGLLINKQQKRQLLIQLNRFLDVALTLLAYFSALYIRSSEVDPIVKTVFFKNKIDAHAALYAMSGVIPPTDECGLKPLYFSI